jgi:surface antigen
MARAGFAQVAHVAALVVALAGLSGCAATSALTPPPAATAAVTPPPPPPPYVGLASGSLGQSLNANGKAAADKAEFAAVTSGERKTWRGDDGSYGYIAPGASTGDCRDFTHTIYINGRPQVGSGKACRAGESWKLS